MKRDCQFKPFFVPEPIGHLLYPLDAGVLGFQHAIGYP
jgi:hypothetical protein